MIQSCSISFQKTDVHLKLDIFCYLMKRPDFFQTWAFFRRKGSLLQRKRKSFRKPGTRRRIRLLLLLLTPEQREPQEKWILKYSCRLFTIIIIIIKSLSNQKNYQIVDCRFVDCINCQLFECWVFKCQLFKTKLFDCWLSIVKLFNCQLYNCQLFKYGLFKCKLFKCRQFKCKLFECQ